MLDLPAWSLCFEVIANFVYAALILKASSKALGVVMAASALALVGVAGGLGSANFGADGWTMFFGLPRVGYSFAAGVLVYRWWCHAGHRLPSVPWYVPPLLLLALVGSPVPTPWRGVADVVAIVAVIPLIGVAALATRLSRSALGIAKLGADLSYPLYMVHVPMIMVAEAAVASLGADPLRSFGIAVVASLVAAGLLDRWFDRPVRRALAGRLLPARQSAAQAVAG